MNTDYHMTNFVEKQMENGVTLDSILQQAQKSDLGDYLAKYICKKDISVEVTAELAGINKASLYRLLNGVSQNPGFNLLIRLSRILELNYDQTQHLLKLGNCKALSGSKPRDIVIMHGIKNHLDLYDLDELLADYNMPGLFNK